MPDDCFVAFQSRPVVSDRRAVSSYHLTFTDDATRPSGSAVSVGPLLTSRTLNQILSEWLSSTFSLIHQSPFFLPSAVSSYILFLLSGFSLIIDWPVFSPQNAFLKGRQTAVSLLEMSLFLQISLRRQPWGSGDICSCLLPCDGHSC